MAERYFMYDPALRDSVLRVVRQWKRLPLSDLFRLLPPEDRLRYRDDVIEDLVWQGLIRTEELGDETVLTLSTSGDQPTVERETTSGPKDVQ
jgi:hypothetical protein